MDYRVILSKPSLRDLGAIARYIAQDNPPAAERVGLELVALAESLSVLPMRGAPLRSRPGARRLVRDPYLVVYRVEEGQRVVNVLRFWRAKQNPAAMHLQ
jgi:plasmid stabilization system protein ParE